MSGANTYTGQTLINGGTLLVSGSLSDLTDVLIGEGSVYELGASDRVGSISGDGSIALNAFRLTAGNELDATFSGVMSGEGGFTKVGSGVLTFTGQNTYSGSTNVDEGELSVQGSGPSTATCADGATSNVCVATFELEPEPNRARA